MVAERFIAVRLNRLPGWLGLGLIGADLLFDETTCQEMEKALKLVQEAKKSRLAELRAMNFEDAALSELPLSINTIDGFQGQERDVAYISLVRSNGKGEIGFLKDYRRMNVAMARARKKLAVVGDSPTIGNDGFYGAFLDYCEQEGVYRTAWEYMR